MMFLEFKEGNVFIWKVCLFKSYINIFSLVFSSVLEANSNNDTCIPLKKGRNESKYLIVFSVIIGIKVCTHCIGYNKIEKLYIIWLKIS